MNKIHSSSFYSPLLHHMFVKLKVKDSKKARCLYRIKPFCPSFQIPFLYNIVYEPYAIMQKRFTPFYFAFEEGISNDADLSAYRLSSHINKIFNSITILATYIETLSPFANDCEKEEKFWTNTCKQYGISVTPELIRKSLPVAYMLNEQIYAPQLSLQIMKIVKTVNVLDKETVIRTLSLAIMIPDIFTRNYYLFLAVKLCPAFPESFRYSIKSKHSGYGNRLIYHKKSLEEWSLDFQKFFRHLSLNFYPRLQRYSKEKIRAYYKIPKEKDWLDGLTREDKKELISVLLGYIKDKQVLETYFERLVYNGATVVKNGFMNFPKEKDISILYRKYFENYYNLDTLVRIDDVMKEQCQDSKELMRVIDEYRSSVDFGIDASTSYHEDFGISIPPENWILEIKKRNRGPRHLNHQNRVFYISSFNIIRKCKKSGLSGFVGNYNR